MFILVTGQIKIIFPQNTEAPRRLRSHQFSVGQAPDRAGGLLGCLGGSSRVCLCLWAQESQVFASHLLQAL